MRERREATLHRSVSTGTQSLIHRAILSASKETSEPEKLEVGQQGKKKSGLPWRKKNIDKSRAGALVSEEPGGSGPDPSIGVELRVLPLFPFIAPLSIHFFLCYFLFSKQLRAKKLLLLRGTMVLDDTPLVEEIGRSRAKIPGFFFEGEKTWFCR